MRTFFDWKPARQVFFPFKMRKAADGANKSLLYIVYPVELNVRVSEQGGFDCLSEGHLGLSEI